MTLFKKNDPLGRSMHDAYGFFLRNFFARWVQHLHVPQDSINSIENSGQKNIILYVMPTASALDYVLLNLLCLKYRLPLADFVTDIPFILFQPTFKAMLRGLSRSIALPKSNRSTLEEEKSIVHDLLKEDRTVCVFLKKPGVFKKPELWHVALWEELIRTQKELHKNIHLVPVIFNWGHSPGKMRTSGLDTLFQASSLPGNLEKLNLLLRHPENIEPKIGQSVDLGRFLQGLSQDRLDIQAKKLRRLLASYLYRERKVLTGPPIRPREKVIQRVIKDTHLQKTIHEHAKRKKLSEAEVTKRVRKILEEMVANYKPSFVRLCYHIVSWIQHRLYNNVHVDKENLERLKTLAKEHSILYLPCHRSHMDYILLSKILYEEGITPPHIAAGVNLSFFPMGIIFRNTGAFFIRRKISGDLIYARTLASYIRWLIKAGYSQEFFIEGSRTRTGKLLSPKVGLLSSQIEACMEQNTKDLYLIPTAITYDRVPEESEYRREMLGAKKEKENWKDLLRTKKFLNRKHGNIFIRFGDPISIFRFFEREKAQHILPAKEGIHKLARSVIQEIAKQTVITTSSMICTSILTRDPSKISLQQVRKDILYLKAAAVYAGDIMIADEVKSLENNLELALGFFLSSRWIEKSSEHGYEYKIRENHRLVMSFHRNISLHHFLPQTMHALGHVLPGKVTNHSMHLQTIQSILEYEFPYAKLSPSAHSQMQNFPSEDADHHLFFANLIRDYIVNYSVAAQGLLNASETSFEVFYKTVNEANHESVSFLMAKSAYEYYLQKFHLDLSAIERMNHSLELVLNAI